MTDPNQHIWWLISRASGVVALGLITASVALGLLMANKLLRGKNVAAIHEQLSITGLVAIAVHGLTLLPDPWLHPGVAGIAVPFTMCYRSVFTGVGILAGYLTALLGLSFYIRRRIGPKLWRKAHRFTVLAYVMALVHTIGAGTDMGTAWLRTFLFATAVPIAVLFVARLIPRKRPAKKSAPARDGLLGAVRGGPGSGHPHPQPDLPGG
jgi:methionine sulfoxide reductase heme-binding subunit